MNSVELKRFVPPINLVANKPKQVLIAAASSGGIPPENGGSNFLKTPICQKVLNAIYNFVGNQNKGI